MYWEGVKVNITNYHQVFRWLSKESVEVIRSAILDDTDIVKYIKPKGIDHYLLWQIKLAIDSGLDPFWLDNSKDGEILRELRLMHEKGINISPLKDVYSLGLSKEYYSFILKWYGRGVALERYNFDILPCSMLEAFDYGLNLGFDMSLFNNGKVYDFKYIRRCLEILKNGKDISNFVDRYWDIEVLEILSDLSKRKGYDKIIKYLNYNITPGVLDELILCFNSGMPLDVVTKVDEEGYYIFSDMHIRIIREAYLDDLDYERLYLPYSSLDEMYSIKNELEIRSKGKISGRLGKR